MSSITPVLEQLDLDQLRTKSENEGIKTLDLSYLPAQYHAILLHFVKKLRVLHAKGIVMKSDDLMRALGAMSDIPARNARFNKELLE